MKNFSDISITKQFLGFLILLFVFLLVGFPVFLYFQSSSAIERAMRDVEYLSSVQGNRVERIVEDYVTRFESLRNIDEFGGLMFNAVSLYAPDDFDETIGVKINEFLKFFQPDFRHIAFFTDSGEIIYSDTGQDVALSYFDPAIVYKSDKTVVRIHNQGRDDMVFVLSNKYRLKNGISGILVVSIEPTSLLSFIEDFESVRKTGEVQIFYRFEGKTVSILPKRFTTRTNSPANDFLDSNTPVELGFENKEDAYTTFHDYRNRKVILAVSYLPSTNWVLLTKIDKGEVLWSLSILMHSILITLVGLLAICAVLSVYFYIIVVTPIKELTGAAKRIKEGTFDTDSILTFSAKNEIGTLAGAFGSMSGAIQRSKENLEKKVADRTRVLKRQVAEIRREKVKDDALLSSIGEGMVVVDTSGNIQMTNDAAGSIFGWKKEVAGSPFSKVVVLLDENENLILGKHDPTLQSLESGRPTHQVQYLSKKTNGDTFPISLTCTPIKLDKKILGAVVIIRDITKENEISRMKSEFISIASHQLRGPLASLKWYGELLGKGEVGKLRPKQNQYLERMNISTERMISLVDDFLNVSRIETGKIMNKPEHVKMHELVSNIIDTYSQTIKEKKLSVDVHDHLRKKTVYIDPSIIREICANFIANAIKYSKPSGSVVITLDEAGSGLKIEVEDTGVGIPKDEQKNVFSKFFRAGNVLEKGHKGTGLGLYTARLLLNRIGGKVSFESEEGEGTKFTIIIPRICKRLK